ncbi:MAG: hypothetical protein K2W95_23420 [Candidatus Obscuribacterales bacterium]|nr:hypothetical protein [Candidatus Obscuribacterales bacterium]
MLKGFGYFSVALLMAYMLCVSPGQAERTTTLNVVGGKIIVQIDDGKLNLTDEEILAWVKRSSDAIVEYFGRMPLERIVLKITPVKERGVGYSTATAGDHGEGLIEVPLGRTTTAKDLEKDWILTHEFVHTNFPLATGKHGWISEGIAVYVEPIARMQAGHLEKSKVWGELMRDLPQGLPQRGDRGLSRTPTWERTYWGGALFYFMADLEIRKRTNNDKGLQDALRAIAHSGGNICSDWSVEKCFEIGDRATGVPVLQELYAKMSTAPVAVDLPLVWKQMGMERQGDRATFARAPLSETREVISNGMSSNDNRVATRQFDETTN